MAKALLEWETIDSEQIDDIINGKPPRPPKSTSSSPPAGGKSASGGVEGAAQPA
jgi:cell division protease FtsH